MTKSASELYQSTILEHNRNPRGYGDLSGATHRAEGFNPICGDRIVVSARIADKVLVDVKFTAQCCALCRASASVLMEEALQQSVEFVSDLLISFEDMVRGRSNGISGSASVFSAIKDYPARAKCVILPWRTLSSALKNQSSVTTEDQE